MSGFRERALADYERFCRVWPGEPLGHEVFLAGARFALEEMLRSHTKPIGAFRRRTSLLVEPDALREALADLQSQPERKKP